jgi:hypothetical protein
VEPVPDPLLLRKFGSAGNRTRISEFVARNSDHRGGQKVYESWRKCVTAQGSYIELKFVETDARLLISL